MQVVALAGGIGAGRFLRGLTRALSPEEVTVVINTADDVSIHGLHVSPDLDSVLYWLAGEADRERGWGRRGETFRATAELQRLSAPDAWFSLGDADLALHLYRTQRLKEDATLSEVLAEASRAFGVKARLLPMSDQPVTTRIDAVDDEGRALDLHFQEYWVKRGAADQVKAVRYAGVESARPAPGVIEAISAADAVVICPSNPVVSIGPILAVPGVRDGVRARRDQTVGISPIVKGAVVRGMADRLMPSVGLEVTSAGAAAAYRDLLRAWVVDDNEVDRALIPRIESWGIRAGVTDTIMSDDSKAERLATFALDLLT